MIAADRIPSELVFSEGLVGLPNLRRFTAIRVGEGALVDLAALDDAGFGFAALPADVVRHGFAATLVAHGVADEDDLVLVLLAVHGEPPVVTANLAGPIVLQPDGSARQLVLEGPEFPLRAPVGPVG